MSRSKGVRREVGKLSKSGALGMAGLVLLLGGGLSWAAPPNPTLSDDFENTAGGTGALRSNLGSDISGYANTGFGFQALYSNTEGVTNTAFGNDALFSNTTG